MQAIELQKPTDKKLTLTGENGIYPYLIERAQERIKNKVHKPEKEPDNEIAVLVRDYERVTDWIYDKPQDEQEKYLIIPKQIRAEALRIMVNYNAGSEKQMSALRIKGSDILFEKAIQSELAEYIILSLLEYDFLIDELKKIAEGGKLVYNPKIRDLQDDYRTIREKEKMLIASQFPTRAKKKDNAEPEPEASSLNRGEMLPDEYIPEAKPLTLRECTELVRQYRKQIREEKRAQAREFSQPQHLCFSLLYSERVEQYAEGFRMIPIEPYERAEQFRKSSLKNLLALIIRLINDHYSNQINEHRKLKTKMNRQRNSNKLTPTEKRELIQMGKGEGYTNKEIALQLNIPLRTVERYSKN